MTNSRPPLSQRLFEQHPGRTAAWLIAAHVAAWTVVPWVVNSALPLDTVEALAWGHEWQWGYDKHPPLSAWAAELGGMALGRSDLGLYLLSALCTGGGLALMWVLTRELLGAKAATLAVVLLEGVYYHNFTSPEFNVNVLQVPLWALAMLAYWRAVRRRSLAWWVVLGAAVALGFLSKYLAGALLIALLVYTLRRERWVFKTPGPYVAAAVAGLIFLPHAVWVVNHEFITLFYGVRRASGDEHRWLGHLTHPAWFLVAQLAAMGGLIWLLGVWKPRRRPGATDEQEARGRAYLLTLAVVPVGVLAVLSLLTGLSLRSMWATPMLLAVGPCALAYLQVAFPQAKPRDGLVWAGVIFVLPIALYAFITATAASLFDNPKRVNYPGPAIAHEAEQRWAAHFDQPLDIVVGHQWEAGLVAWYGEARPSVYIKADPQRAPWIDDEMVRRRGALVIWLKSDGPSEEGRPLPYENAAERWGTLIPAEDIVVPYPSAPDKPALRFGVALVEPKLDG